VGVCSRENNELWWDGCVWVWVSASSSFYSFLSTGTHVHPFDRELERRKKINNIITSQGIELLCEIVDNSYLHSAAVVVYSKEKIYKEIYSYNECQPLSVV
jgi:hypothetical protein